MEYIKIKSAKRNKMSNLAEAFVKALYIGEYKDLVKIFEPIKLNNVILYRGTETQDTLFNKLKNHKPFRLKTSFWSKDFDTAKDFTYGDIPLLKIKYKGKAWSIDSIFELVKKELIKNKIRKEVKETLNFMETELKVYILPQITIIYKEIKKIKNKKVIVTDLI
jgi:hypothetical protein